MEHNGSLPPILEARPCLTKGQKLAGESKPAVVYAPFMFFCGRSSMVMMRLSMRACLFAAASSVAWAQAASGFPPQNMLDSIARPLPATGAMAMPKEFPGHFADWTEAQKQSGFRLVSQRCGLMFALQHDNPAARMVPEAMTRREEAELAMSVCVTAKLPADWPGRQKYIDTAQHLIAKANANGGSLSLPPGLK